MGETHQIKANQTALVLPTMWEGTFPPAAPESWQFHQVQRLALSLALLEDLKG